jgi:hypothetical protein
MKVPKKHRSTPRRTQVSNAIQAGTIFLREGIRLPDTLQIASEPYMSGWRLVKDLDAISLGRKIEGTGWTFFSLAGHTGASVLGRESQDVVRSAVQRILTKLKSEKFNSMEITSVVPKRFLGVPYVTVTARSRHIQEGVFLFGTSDVHQRDRAYLAAA